MGSKEVITFQLGNYSNYIGSHWWNIQESSFQYDESTPSEICHDVLFREGKTLEGHVTFTPRLIMCDKNLNSSYIPKLFEPAEHHLPSTWENDKISLEHQKMREKHEFVQDLENIDSGQQIDVSKKDYSFDQTVESWCDYTKMRYHPRSLCLVKDDIKTEVYNSGLEIYRTLEEEFIDRIRNYMEECDNLQGFQIIVDAVDGFSGLGNSILLHLQDEYSSKSLFTFPVFPSYYDDSSVSENVSRAVSTVLSFQNLAENSTVLIPLSTNDTSWLELGAPINFPNLIYDQKLLYHTSAILASFLDTMSLRYRLKDSPDTIHDLTTGLIFPSKKIAAASMALPFPLAPNSYLLNSLEGLDEGSPIWRSLTPGCDVNDSKVFYQDIVLCGLSPERLFDPEAPKLNDNKAYSCTTVKDLLNLYLSFRCSTVSHVTTPKSSFKTAAPYPNIFSPHVSRFGSVDPLLTRAEGFNVEHCPALSGLHSCKGISDMLDSLYNQVKRINIKRFPQFMDSGMILEEYQESLESILNLKSCYEDENDYI